MNPIKLSICICSLHERHELLVRLLKCLAEQSRLDEVQILVNIDAGQQTIGIKRNHLMMESRGAYIVHVDDDDLVHPAYTAKILEAIDANPNVDAIAIRGRRTDIAGKDDPITFDYRVMRGDLPEYDKLGVMWRSPGHLCPIRADISCSVPFPEIEPEDLARVEAISSLIHTIARAGAPHEILYHYLWDSSKTYRWNQPCLSG